MYFQSNVRSTINNVIVLFVLCFHCPPSPRSPSRQCCSLLSCVVCSCVGIECVQSMTTPPNHPPTNGVRDTGGPSRVAIIGACSEIRSLPSSDERVTQAISSIVNLSRHKNGHQLILEMAIALAQSTKSSPSSLAMLADIFIPLVHRSPDKLMLPKV
jgi:hypothetical protein